MTVLRHEAYCIPAADVGPENPLPVFRGESDDAPVGLHEAVPEEDRRYMGWRTAFRVLPYRMQDGYSRERHMRELPAIVLENELLQALFLPGTGGKLARLLDRRTGRELIHRNPVYQPANLALRNAWTSGGIEWNAGQPGHHYLTCSPVWAARVAGPDGSPCLRLYEWDRVKGFVWQMDFWLPDGSPVLFVHTRIVNPHPYEIAMYWWTNIAVDEREDVRVLVPAETALCNPYFRALEVAPLPQPGDFDITYPLRSPHAADFFSRIPDDRRRWIAAVDGDGRGFFETSTPMLRGRKLFCWGNGPGGRRWQEFLALPGHAYIEIQAGLCRTQMECIPMPGYTEWSWTEAFGAVETDPHVAHGPDWTAAWQRMAADIERICPASLLDRAHAMLERTACTPGEEILANGSGWGALERLRRRRAGEPDGIPPELVFPDPSPGADETPWRILLEEGYLPERDPREEPGAFMTQEEWGPILEASVASVRGDHWLAWWHLGNLRMEHRDLDGACEAWRRSLQRARTCWALRNLAAAAMRKGHQEEALGLLEDAWEAGPHVAPLAIELAQALLAAERHREVADLIRGLPEEVRSHERLVLMLARAELALGEFSSPEIFERDFAAIREGEVTLTDLWFAYHEQRLSAETGRPVDDDLRRLVRAQYPPPHRIDFRMATP